MIKHPKKRLDTPTQKLRVRRRILAAILSVTLVAGFNVTPNAKASLESETNATSRLINTDDNLILAENIYAEQPKTLSFEIVESEFHKNLVSNPEALIRFYAKDAGLDEDLLVCMANKESTLNPNAVSKSGKYVGLFQFDSSTFGEGDRTDPELNVKRAVELMKKGEWGRWPTSYGLCRKSQDLSVELTVSIVLKERSPNATNCVKYLESIGIDVPNGYGLAKNIPVSTKTPHVGAIMVSFESTAGHVSVVREVRADTLVIEDGNYFSGYRTIRIINRNSSLIKGFVYN